ncbi:MAG: hypothetical protein AAF921_09635 [Cyanobacteria bacterium P01_D01_bin.44]
MDRSKIVAIITGVISLALAIAYLVLVQLLDFRGEMVPAPVGMVFPFAIDHDFQRGVSSSQASNDRVAIHYPHSSLLLSPLMSFPSAP